MTKVAIISMVYHNYNYGGMLQGYAMAQALQNLGVEAEQVRLDQRKLPDEVMKAGRVKRTAYSVMYKLRKGHILRRAVNRVRNRREKRLRQQCKEQPFFQERMRAFEDFYRKQVPHTEREYGSSELAALNEIFDAFVCGSDVIWHQDSYFTPWEYYLAFVSGEKPRIAYAPSFGSNSIPRENYVRTREVLEPFCALSVREESGRRIVREASGLEAMVVVDPTMLLTAEEWDRVAISPVKRNAVKRVVSTSASAPKTAANAEEAAAEKYAFAYLLGVNPQIHAAITRYCREKGLHLITVPYGSGILDSREQVFGDEQVLSASPGEWIGLIRDAEIVFTDSFHGAVFSSIYETDFYAFRRHAETDRNSLNTRVENLVEKLGIPERLIAPEALRSTNEKPIDWKAVNARRAAWVGESREYLMKAVNEHVLNKRAGGA